MQFTYLAIDEKGTRQKGSIEANSEGEVVKFLRQNKLTTIKVKNESKSNKVLILSPLKKVSQADIVLFTRQLSSMILTGLTLIESLDILKKQANKPLMANMISDLIASISEGKSFSGSLETHKEVFSNVYIALVKAAETGGMLDKVLARLADNLEKAEDLKKKIKSAMFYPIIVIGGVVAVIVVMNIFVIPQLGALYENLNISLPITTQIVLATSKLFTKFLPFTLGAIAILFVFYKRYTRTETGIQTIDKIKLKIPVFGSIITLSVLDEITRTLSLLIGSGTSIIESLNITANVANNYWYKQAIKTSAGLVEKGVPLSQAFQNQNIFPIILIQMVRVGESTGKIDDSLVKVAEYFERDLDLQIKNLTTSIEPIVIIVLGVVVAFLILSVITPIYGLIGQIQ